MASCRGVPPYRCSCDNDVTAAGPSRDDLTIPAKLRATELRSLELNQKKSAYEANSSTNPTANKDRQVFVPGAYLRRITLLKLTILTSTLSFSTVYYVRNHRLGHTEQLSYLSLSPTI